MKEYSQWFFSKRTVLFKRSSWVRQHRRIDIQESKTISINWLHNHWVSHTVQNNRDCRHSYFGCNIAKLKNQTKHKNILRMCSNYFNQETSFICSKWHLNIFLHHVAAPKEFQKLLAPLIHLTWLAETLARRLKTTIKTFWQHTVVFISE